MKSRYKNLLDKLGYDTSRVGAMFFGDLISEVSDLLKSSKSEKEVIEMLPSIYLENYHFDYGVGKRTYFIELNKFLLKKKNINNIDDDIELFNYFNSLHTLDELVIFFCKYTINLECNDKSDNKVYCLK